MFEELLARVALALDAGGIPYMVIGGQAVIHYGEPRFTKDIDLTLGVDVASLPAVLAAVDRAHLTVLVDDVRAFVTERNVLPCQDAASGLRVDLIFSDLPYERQAIDRAVKKDIGGAPISIATLEDTVIHKLVANRPRDLEDVLSMLLKNPGIDRRYVRGWLRQFDAALDDGRLMTFERLLRRTQRGRRGPA